MPQIFDLIQNLHPPIATAFLNMLHFNPHDRPTINFKSLFNGKVYPSLTLLPNVKLYSLSDQIPNLPPITP